MSAITVIGKSSQQEIAKKSVQRTQVLNILVRGQHHRALLLGSWTEASSVCLVDDDAIRCSRGNECNPVGDLGPSGVVIEGDVGEDVSEDTEQEGQMSANRVSKIMLIMSLNMHSRARR